MYLSVSLSMYRYLTIYDQYIYPCFYPSIFGPLVLSFYLSIYLSIYLHIYLFVYIPPRGYVKGMTGKPLRKYFLTKYDISLLGAGKLELMTSRRLPLQAVNHLRQHFGREWSSSGLVSRWTSSHRYRYNSQCTDRKCVDVSANVGTVVRREWEHEHLKRFWEPSLGNLQYWRALSAFEDSQCECKIWTSFISIAWEKHNFFLCHYLYLFTIFF